MFKKISKICFVMVFATMIALPMLFINLEDGAISEAEKRKLVSLPSVHNEDGSLNTNITRDFEAWINDNIGFRPELVVANARIMFYGFNVLPSNSDMYLGPNQELAYITPEILIDCQHLNLISEEDLDAVASAYQTFSDYLTSRGIQYYYFQCWDKQSIYPEHFPESIRIFGDISKTDQIVDCIAAKTNINIISPKKELIEAKKTYDPYSVWGDATHWTQRGAYIAYIELMEAINANNDGKYKVLQEDDYDITITDQGNTLFGGIHKQCMMENFEIKDPKACKSDEAPLFENVYGVNCRNVLYNDAVDNDDTLLIIGDSYFDFFIYDDLGESFHKVVMVWGGEITHIKELVDYYKPTIVINESAERNDVSYAMITVANFLNQ